MYTSPVALLSEEISRNKVGGPEGLSRKRGGSLNKHLIYIKKILRVLLKFWFISLFKIILYE